MAEDRKLREILLLKEFDQHFQEKLLHMQRYHRQTDFLQIYVAVVVGLGAVTFAPATTSFLQPGDFFSDFGLEAISCVFVLLAALVAEYLLFNILDSWVVIFRNAHRLAALEKELNELCGTVSLR